MNRREFLTAIGYSSLLFGTSGIPNIASADNDYLNQDLGSSGILSPDRFDDLSHREMMQLRKYAEYIRTTWDIPCSLNQWESMVSAKVREEAAEHDRIVFPPPSYYTEYHQAITALEKLSESYGNEDALKELFRLENNMVQDPLYQNTRRGHIRKYVISEFSYVLMRDGGFRKYGYDNYRAYIGGALHNSAPESSNWPYTIYEGERLEKPSGAVFEMPLLGDEQ